MSKKITSINIEKKILKGARKLAIDEGVTFSYFVEQLLKKALEKA